MKTTLFIAVILLFECVVFAQDTTPPSPPPPPAKKTNTDSDTPRKETAGEPDEILVRRGPPPPPAKIGGGFGPSSSPPARGFQGPQPDELVKLENKEFGFSIEFFTSPKKAVNQIRGALEYSFQSNPHLAHSAISVTDFPYDLRISNSESEILTYAKNRLLQRSEGVITSEKQITSGRLKGIEFETAKGKDLYRTRVFYIENKIFELTYKLYNWQGRQDTVAETALLGEAEIKRFFDSFQTLKQDPAQKKTVSFDLAKTGTGRLPVIIPPNNRYDPKTKRFESFSGSFSSFAPSAPIRKFSQLVDGDLVYDIESFFTLDADYVVTFQLMHLPIVLADDNNRRMMADLQIQNVLQSQPDLELVRMSDLNYKGKFGREYDFVAGEIGMTIRIFLIKDRLYKFIHVSQKDNTGAAKVETHRKNYFDSIEFTGFETTGVKQITLPKDFGIIVEEKSVSSTFLGFSIDIPAGWGVMSDEFDAAVVKETLEELKDEKNIDESIAKGSIGNTRIVISLVDLTEESDRALSIMAEALQTPIFTGASIIAELGAGEKITDEGGEIKIGGVVFNWFEFETTDVGERQRIYAVNRNDLAIQIAFVFQKDEDIRPYMQLLESLEFTDEIRLK